MTTKTTIETEAKSIIAEYKAQGLADFSGFVITKEEKAELASKGITSDADLAEIIRIVREA